MYDDNVIYALVLTLMAGLSTGIGSVLAFFTKRTNTKFLAFSLGFSAGVMIYVSFVELLQQGRELLKQEVGNYKGEIWAVASFFIGIIIIAVIDKLVPETENPHEVRHTEKILDYEENLKNEEKEKNIIEETKRKKLMRTGIITALVIGIHNFPEGLATFMTSLKDVKLGVPIAVAIAIHNIPEGIAVSVPIFFATGKKGKAFFWSFVSGLSEPLGAVIGYLILKPFMNDAITGAILAAVAGIMVFISLDELLPAAQEFGEHHLPIYGVVAGMVVMALSLIMLA